MRKKGGGAYPSPFFVTPKAHQVLRQTWRVRTSKFASSPCSAASSASTSRRIGKATAFAVRVGNGGPAAADRSGAWRYRGESSSAFLLCPVATEPGCGARKRCCVKGSCYRRWNLSRALPLMERNKMELGYEQHRLACWSRCHRYCGPQSGRVRLISNLKSCRQWRQSDQRRET